MKRQFIKKPDGNNARHSQDGPGTRLGSRQLGWICDVAKSFWSEDSLAYADVRGVAHDGGGAGAEVLSGWCSPSHVLAVQKTGMSKIIAPRDARGRPPGPCAAPTSTLRAGNPRMPSPTCLPSNQALPSVQAVAKRPRTQHNLIQRQASRSRFRCNNDLRVHPSCSAFALPSNCFCVPCLFNYLHQLGAYDYGCNCPPAANPSSVS